MKTCLIAALLVMAALPVVSQNMGIELVSRTENEWHSETARTVIIDKEINLISIYTENELSEKVLINEDGTFIHAEISDDNRKTSAVYDNEKKVRHLFFGHMNILTGSEWTINHFCAIPDHHRIKKPISLK